MSRYLSSKLASLTPYTPGEQPQDLQYVKLNTNESPFPPSKKALEYAAEHQRSLNLYPDPTCEELVRRIAMFYRVTKEEVMLTNGSDEALFFSFLAYADEMHPAVFADITYGFYPVFAEINRVPYEEVPLREDLSLRIEDYDDRHGLIVIANPNAPTGIALSMREIDLLLQRHPDDVVVVDEAYVDFGAESCIQLTKKHDNLLVVQTFSKSRSMAGARLGFVIGDRRLIRDLNTVRYSFNPYNINSMTMSLAMGTMLDGNYTLANCLTIEKNREYTVKALQELGFEMTDSKANFLFARHKEIEGGSLYRALKEKGVLVRHFDKERISDYNRITIGTKEQMDCLLQAIREILAETERE